MNKITLIGNLTHDPEIRSTQSGVTVCAFTIAVSRRFAGADGERPTDYFRVNAWRQLGESCGRYLAKGRKVAVFGELQARLYEAKDGSTRMSLDVQADEVEFLSPRQQDDGKPSGKDDAGADMAGFTDVSADDIPF
ncbi:MAG: single-stranded DNA-binding protein [Eubacteriales bacterium]|nr:single-stranded DNA-binding protein [Eubacteriales bacterium]